MIATGPYIIHALWMPPASILLWGSRKQGGMVDAAELKYLMFAWHAPSFYGTFAETNEWGGKEGVAMTAEEALEYFSTVPELQHASLEWSPEAAALRAHAPQVRQALAAGSLMPDYEKWRKGTIGWKLALPEDAPGIDSPLFRAYTDALVGTEVRRRPELRDALEKLEEMYPRIARGDLDPGLWLDEEDWLVSIGWKPDTTPFRTCIRLDEPELGHTWKLQVLLQDRKEPSHLVAVDPSGQPAAGETLPEEWSESLVRINRDKERWLHMLPLLQEPDAPLQLKTGLTQDEAWEFLTSGSLRLAEAGVTVFLPSWWEKLRRVKPRLKVKMKSSVGSTNQSTLGMAQLMAFDWRMAIGDMELTEEEFQGLLEEKSKLIRFRGQWIQLDPKQLEKIQAAMSQVKRRKGLTFRDVLEMHLLTMDGVREQDGDEEDWEEFFQIEVELNQHLRELIDRLNEHRGVPMLEPPAGFQGSLRPYQLEGVSWMLFLRQFGMGGCLADDMGLGKTIQWISYLLSVKEQEQEQPSTPSLLICPTSVLGNWQKELQRFAPSLRVHLHYGPNRLKGEGFQQAAAAADLVLTSYTLVHLDEKDFSSVYWNSICLDEAQNIKNSYTKQSGAVRRLDGIHRIAMTGTPIENRLTELWSIFDFLNPNYLGTLKDFTTRFVSPIERNRDAELISAVQRLIRPFLLRRLKKDPAIQLDLPDKNEAKVFLSLTAEQVTLYENLIRDMFDRIDRAGAMERRGLILASLTKLKQICNHPALYLKEQGAYPWRERSNKVERLLDMVGELRQEGDRCLIFTQFVEAGFMLQSVLQEELGEHVPFLHGGSSKAARDEMVAAFQDDTRLDSERNGIFILSLKAGGIGLNLTAANHVFHFDRWWNPAVENQATDRAFRIGQTRHVQVHKFVTLGTLEERIDDMIDRKQGLSQQIVGGSEGWITELSTDELKDLFALRREWISG